MLIYNILLIIQIIVALSIIGLVLIQHGKGADAGAAFGGGASAGTVFGSQGSGNFLSRSTGVLAAIFFANSLALAWLVAHRGDSTILSPEQSVVPQETTREVKPAPVAEPAVPSDVPANIGSSETNNAKPTTGTESKTPSDVPAKVENVDAKITSPVAETGSQTPSDIPVATKPPAKEVSAPADVPQ